MLDFQFASAATDEQNQVAGVGPFAAGPGEPSSMLPGSLGSPGEVPSGPPAQGEGGGSPESVSAVFSHLAEARSSGSGRLGAAASRALHGMRAATGGAPLPDLPLVQRMERAYGTSFGDIRIHTDEQAGQFTQGVQGGAVNLGTDIFFAPGRWNAGSDDGQRLLAEELAHFVQHGGRRATGGTPRLGATNSGAEQEAQAMSTALVQGAALPPLSRGHDPNVARRGEAPVHQGIEMEAGDAGVGPKLMADLSKPAPAAGTRAAGLLQVYSGNFMRDLSQLNVPLITDKLSKMPKSGALLNQARGNRPLNYQTVGAAGAESIITGLIRALAVLELGQPITQANVTKKNIGAYRPEEHIDNPIGLRSPELLVRDGSSGQRRPAHAAGSGPDADRDRELAGSAVPGTQVDNPSLYKYSDQGLANHIYNSIEYAKSQWLLAAQAGPSAGGRMHLGAGLHVVEDYFSHSNFIEVALNKYISRLLSQSVSTKSMNSELRKFANNAKKTQPKSGLYVDTLYDATTAPRGRGRPGGRQVVTTGTFGGTDTKVSIAHILLPKLPKLQDALMRAVDRLVGLPVEKHGAGAVAALFKQDRSTQALYELGGGLKAAGVVVPAPTDYELSVSSPYFIVKTHDTDLISAVVETANFIQRVKSDITSNPLYWIINKVVHLADIVTQFIADLRERVRKAAKAAIAQFMVSVIASLTGLDPEKLAKMQIGDVLNLANGEVGALEHTTSIQSRLQPGGDLADLPKEELERTIGPVEGEPGHYHAKGALPPSHSEISKDHEPHDERLLTSQPASGEKPAYADGSLFYGLHRALAVEADRHVFLKMQAVWAATASAGGDRSLFGDGVMFQTQTQVAQADITQQADTRAHEEGARAQRDGHRHGPQSASDRAYVQSHPQVQELLNLADLFISHPDASSWWHSLFDSYVSQHQAEVTAHIRARNATRGERR